MIEEYKIDTDSTRLVKTRRAKVGKNTRIYEVTRAEPPTFIIDTPMAREIARGCCRSASYNPGIVRCRKEP
jgi:hypothetical protein